MSTGLGLVLLGTGSPLPPRRLDQPATRARTI